MIKVIKIFFWVGILAVNSFAFASGDEKDRKTGEINLNLQNVSLRNTLQLLCNQLGKNLLLDAEVRGRILNMNFKSIAPIDAFNAILRSNNLAYKEMSGNILFVAKAEKIGNRDIIKDIACKYADADEMVKILRSVVSQDSGSVIADKRTNTLIIKGTPESILKMERLIERLDQPTKQIYIQAAIVEVSSTNGQELGIDWLWQTANYKSFDGNIGTDFGLTANPQGTAEAKGSGIPSPLGTGLGIGILNMDIQAVLHAMNEVNNVNLLSRPRIVTMDNQQAVIEVGDQIPFKKLNQFGVTSFEFKDATVQLLVKPHIIDSEYILLEVSPKADFQNGFTPDGTPIISTRKASTKVKVRNGQTLVIGGLIRDSLIKNEKKVPILGDIPLLGLLFKSTISTQVKTELIVFITPLILEDEISPTYFDQDFELKNKLENDFK